MNDQEGLNPPPQAAQVLAEATAIGFTLSCDDQTGALLRTLAASKPGGHFLEIGTGVGYSTSWLLAGMDADSRLVTVEKEASHNRIAMKYLGGDPRVSFVTGDAAKFIGELVTSDETMAGKLDFIFADTATGKLTHLEEVLSLVKPGGIFLVDDMLPKAETNFVPDPRYIELTEKLENHPDFVITKLGWASGLIIATRKA
ncbi:MAG: class I SAM-dependent methyltransferase [Chloroflexi bacterium]|nr:class I SAM-dependent methyltransferase [Chloroflexota bacterium]OJV86785.1 MAG: hypothetical protein BGO39_13165 [Chloroflexi bacterium 54-19]